MWARDVKRGSVISSHYANHGIVKRCRVSDVITHNGFTLISFSGSFAIVLRFFDEVEVH